MPQLTFGLSDSDPKATDQISTSKIIAGKTAQQLAQAKDVQTQQEVVVYRLVESEQLWVMPALQWQTYPDLTASVHASVAITDEMKMIDSNSSRLAKITIFQSLFVGRTDVYARAWQSKNGQRGYAPVCINLWHSNICRKPRGSCHGCPHKEYAPLTQAVIEAHLQGKIVAGIYPLLPDESCKVLAIDFDDEKWQEDVLAVYHYCQKAGWPVYIERSRSGSGAHLWFFFKQALPARQVRQLGSAILSDCQKTRPEIKFDSFDRMFPNQDTLPKGGLGNLIALPLQKAAREQGNSVFVDEKLQVIPDQWQFLSQILTWSPAMIEQVLTQLTRDDDRLLRPVLSETKNGNGWQPSLNTSLNNQDFPEQVVLTLANMIYIDKKHWSKRALAQLKRLAAFANPEFYRAQAMRLSTYGKPRIISSSQEDDDYLMLPRGLLDHVKRLLDDHHVLYQVRDNTQSGKELQATFLGQLRSDQEPAVAALLAVNHGLLVAGTAFGKTVVAANLIASRQVNTLILVHRASLLEQWQRDWHSFCK